MASKGTDDLDRRDIAKNMKEDPEEYLHEENISTGKDYRIRSRYLLEASGKKTT